MKSFIDKFASKESRLEFLYLIIPFILWIFCFRHFFTGQLNLEADAISYAEHIGFYTDNLSKGIFPLWRPNWYSGVPYHFFLRRIGDVNPLLFVIVLLKWVGVSSTNAYLFYLSLYYFLGAWALYLMARFILEDRFYASIAYILFLFSSWGSEIFYNYIIIIFVPIIWFFYFLLSFSRNQKRGSFLGACFCIALVVTTYIPFFFLTIFTIFSFLYILFYTKDFYVFISKSVSFIQKNKIFIVLCVTFLLASCIPGLIFYKESKGGEFVLPNRHSGADVSSVVAVGLQNVASGDIISHGYFDRVFDDHEDIDMGDIYFPYIFFLILLMTIPARVNKSIFFLLFNILGLSLITITSAAGVHRFLYEHIIVFKFIRNIYYFFWLAILPMGILLSVVSFKSLLESIKESTNKTAWLFYIIACHFIFAVFLLTHHSVLWGAWAALILSLLYFAIYFFCDNKIAYLAGFVLILLSVFIQSNQVYDYLDKKLYKEQKEDLIAIQNRIEKVTPKLDLYYSTSWFAVLVNYISPQVLEDYRSHPFIMYDNVIPYADSSQFFKTLESTMARNLNIVFLPRSESGPNDWRSNPNAISQADFNPIASKKISILYSDPNTLILRTTLGVSQFLVINNNYNSSWRAYINGHQVQLFRANVSFQGLWIPSGDLKVELRYASPKRYILHFAIIVFFTGMFLYLIFLLIKNKAVKNNG